MLGVNSSELSLDSIGDRESFLGLKKYRGVEQLVAHRAHNPRVVGSSPTPATFEGLCIKHRPSLF